MLKIEGLSKSYEVDNEVYKVLKDVSFEVKTGEFVAIMGPSGSGKTTLLNSIAHFIPYDFGSVLLNDKALDKLNEDEFADVRNKEMGFIFQDFMLLDGLSVFENVCVPQILGEGNIEEMEKRATNLLELFNIIDIKDKYPINISGGQKQRVAISRSLINKPLILLADEPTGNLDSKSAQNVIDAFMSARDNLGVTTLMVTHDINAASFCDRVILIKDGYLYKDMYQKECDSRKAFVELLFSEMKYLEE